jgi:TRAP-type C4-dicarboxylate transport system permease small subunit
MALVHGRLANTAMLYFGILALWAFWRYFRRQGPDSSYFGALAIGEILILFQGALGGYLALIAGLAPGRSIHFLYGVISLLGIPAVYAFTRGRDERRDSLVYGAVLLFMVGILFRATQTGYGF